MLRNTFLSRWMDIWTGRCEVFGAVRRRIRRRCSSDQIRKHYISRNHSAQSCTGLVHHIRSCYSCSCATRQTKPCLIQCFCTNQTHLQLNNDVANLLSQMKTPKFLISFPRNTLLHHTILQFYLVLYDMIKNSYQGKYRLHLLAAD